MLNKTAGTLPCRDEIEAKYKWQLEDIYADEKYWEEDFLKIRYLSTQLADFRGTLAQGPDKLLQCFQHCNDMLSLNDKLFAYARMRRDENNAEPKYQALTDRAMALSTEVYAAVAFIVPEIIALDEQELSHNLEQVPELRQYKHYINEILRQKQHILSDKEEELLALSAEVAHAPYDIFTMYNNADIVFPAIVDENGDEVELTKGRYIKFLEARDRRVREDAFHALYKTYGAMKNTLAAALGNNIKKNRFFAKVRRYDSCMGAALDDDNVSTDVYYNLISTVNKNLHLLHRYLRLRKKALKLDTLHMYDLYVPMVEMPKKIIPYEAAVKMVTNGLQPLGGQYLQDLEKAFGSGWIDVFESRGKTSGAYSSGTYLTHPYVLLNYQSTINDVFTLAHEMGHAMHSYYTNLTQPYIYSDYKIFVAEVASTLNESLLIKHLLGIESESSGKAYLLNHYLEEFRGTLFRQTMFAEFEKVIHNIIETGGALNAQELCNIYRELNVKYFGQEVIIDDEIDMEWARIPHFYYSFYVYKYATGISAAASLSRQITEEGAPALERYLGFLSSGGSDYPLNLLKKAGVDLSTPKPIEDAMVTFESILAELETLIDAP